MKYMFLVIVDFFNTSLFSPKYSWNGLLGGDEVLLKLYQVTPLENDSDIKINRLGWHKLVPYRMTDVSLIDYMYVFEKCVWST